jgi:DNA-binding IclR family transcriptional regulator
MGEASVKSATRAFEILEQFDQVQRPLRLKELTETLGYPTSSVAALLKSMTSQGYLAFNPKSHAYVPTSRVSKLASWIPARTFEQGVVLQSLQALQRQTNELVLLATEAGIYLEYVETLRSTQGMQLYVAPGTRRVLVQTGTGWLFLSRRPRYEAVAVYDKTIALGELDGRKFSKKDFLERLEDHRDRNISFVRARDLVLPTAHWGGGMVSTWLPVPGDHRPLALCVGGPADRLEANLEFISECLEAEIARIGRALAKAK